MKAHPPRSLHDRLDDHAGQLVGVIGRERADAGRPRLVELRGEAVGRALGEHVLREHAGEHAVHAADRVADGHRTGGVAVIAAADRQQARAARLPAGALVLHGTS